MPSAERNVLLMRSVKSAFALLLTKVTKEEQVARFTRKKITAFCGKNGGESIDRTVSITLGKGCLTHNDRSFIEENVDGNRSHLNVTYCNVPLKETYHKLFDEALEKYNAKQKRADRRIFS